MFPVDEKWHPTMRKKQKTAKFPRKPTNFRRITSKILPTTFNYPADSGQFYENFQKNTQKRIIPVGMFMRAKSSYPPSITKFTDPPEPISGPENSEFPGKHKKPLNGWDFSDISERKPEKTEKSVKIVEKSIPSPQKYRSEEEEKPEIRENPKKSIKLPELPWSKPLDFDTKFLAKPKKSAKIVENPQFFGKILGFQEKIDENYREKLSLQDDSNILLGNVELAVMAMGFQRKTTENVQKTEKVYNLLLERSDWLMYREEFNDHEDHLPKNPFYSKETISSDFEDYEQELDELKEPEYLTNSEKSASEASLKFLESIDTNNNNSQEDFFGAKTSDSNLNTLKRENSEKIDNFFTSPPPPKLQKTAPQFAIEENLNNDSQKTEELADDDFGANFEKFDDEIEYGIPGTSSRYSELFNGIQFDSTQFNRYPTTESPKFPFFE